MDLIHMRLLGGSVEDWKALYQNVHACVLLATPCPALANDVFQLADTRHRPC